MFAAFTAKTGVKVNFIEQPDNESMFAQAKLSLQTGAVDICEPTVQRTQEYVENGIVQPWDERKINLDGYEPEFVRGATGSLAVIDGRRYLLPSVWGTEALVYNTQDAPMDYGTASLGDLFDPKYVGTVTVRPHSALAAMGRYLDSLGKLPHPFIESYTNMEVMERDWDVILAEAVKAKPNIAQFWKSENEAQAAFRTNGCKLGLCWDSTGFNVRGGRAALRLSGAEGGRLRLAAGLHAVEECQEHRAGAGIRELHRHARRLRARRFRGPGQPDRQGCDRPR